MAALAGQAPDMPSLRGQVTDLFHRAFASSSTIFWLIGDGRQLVDPVFQGIQEQYLSPYRKYFFRQNPFDPGNLGQIASPAVCMEELVPLNRFYRTEYYNDFLRQQKIHRQMAVYFGNGRQISGVIGLHRSRKMGFGKDLKAMGNLMAGHLGAAFERICLTDELRASQDLMAVLAEQSGNGTVLLDGSLNLVVANRQGKTICRLLSQQLCPAERIDLKAIGVPQVLVDDCRALADRLDHPDHLPVVPAADRRFSLGNGRSVRVRIRRMALPGIGSHGFLITLDEIRTDHPG